MHTLQIWKDVRHGRNGSSARRPGVSLIVAGRRQPSLADL